MGESSPSCVSHGGGAAAGSSIVDKDVVAGVVGNGNVEPVPSCLSSTDGTAAAMATTVEVISGGGGGVVALVRSNSNTARVAESPPICSLTGTKEGETGSRCEEKVGHENAPVTGGTEGIISGQRLRYCGDSGEASLQKGRGSSRGTTSSVMDGEQRQASATTTSTMRKINECGFVLSLLPEELRMVVSPSFVFDAEFQAFRLEVAGEDDSGRTTSGNGKFACIGIGRLFVTVHFFTSVHFAGDLLCMVS